MCMKDSRKDDTFWAVLNAAIELEFRKGHLRWTMSDLSRASQVTRSLIYYYFGKSKEGILVEAVKLIGEELFGLTLQRIELWQRGELAESVNQSRRLLERSPHLGSFYMVHRGAPTEVGESLRRLENEYREKLRRFFSEAGEPYQEAIFALLLGLVIAPRLSEEAARKSVQVVGNLLGRELK
jgi:AcrR family transcriptional regulator